MKQLLCAFLLLYAARVEAQYFHKQMPPLPGAGGRLGLSNTVALADNSYAICSSYSDSMFTVLKMDAAGNLSRYKGFALRPYSSPDTASYINALRFAATKDSGITVVFQQIAYDNTVPTDSSRLVVIKLDKQLQVQWAVGKTYAQQSTTNPFTGMLLVSYPVSDDAGNVIFAYSIDTTYGLCKIDPAGNIAAHKKTSTYAGINACGLPGNRFLFYQSDVQAGGASSGLSVYGIDDALNLVSEKHYTIGMPYIVYQYNSPATYRLPLLPAVAIEFIQGSGGSSSVNNSYIVMDTTGRLLQAQRSPLPGLSPVSGVTTDDSSHILLHGYNGAPYIMYTDTAGQVRYYHDLGPSGMNMIQPPFIDGNNVLLTGYTVGAGGISASTDLVQYRRDGSAFCPAHNASSAIPFNSVAFQPVTATQLSVSAGQVTLRNYMIDTVSLALPVWQQLCTATGIGEVQHTAGPTVIYTPQNSSLSVTLPDDIPEARLLVTDIAGRSVSAYNISRQQQIAVLPPLPAGIYTWQLLYHHKNGPARIAGKLSLP
jgi:hypothetical protein